jgi:hypothetical protein
MAQEGGMVNFRDLSVPLTLKDYFNGLPEVEAGTLLSFSAFQLF